MRGRGSLHRPHPIPFLSHMNLSHYPPSHRKKTHPSDRLALGQSQPVSARNSGNSSRDRSQESGLGGICRRIRSHLHAQSSTVPAPASLRSSLLPLLPVNVISITLSRPTMSFQTRKSFRLFSCRFSFFFFFSSVSLSLSPHTAEEESPANASLAALNLKYHQLVKYTLFIISRTPHFPNHGFYFPFHISMKPKSHHMRRKRWLTSFFYFFIFFGWSSFFFERVAERGY